jgi:YebC/PmpR family DNA-binding regulatory protein
MSHSQWEKKKYKKAASESKVSKLYTKLVKLITDEAKKSNGNLESPALKAAILKARNANMPNDNIQRAIKKATEPGNAMESITYEAYGPGGVGIVIEALTDNRNKAVQEIRHILVDNGFSLAGIGSVVWSFKKEGKNWVPTQNISLSEEDMDALSKIIDELEECDEVQDVYVNVE